MNRDAYVQTDTDSSVAIEHIKAKTVQTVGTDRGSQLCPSSPCCRLSVWSVFYVAYACSVICQQPEEFWL